MTNVVAVLLRRPVGDRGVSESLEVVKDGESTLAVDFNYDGKPEIGVWRKALPRGTFDESVRRLHEAGWERLPFGELMMPGMEAILFGERRTGDTEPTTREFSSTPRELQDLQSLLMNTAVEMRANAHPYRVLRGEAHWKSDLFEQGRTVEIEVTLSNPGVVPLQWSNPLYGPASEYNGLMLAFVRDGSRVAVASSFPLQPKNVRMVGDAPTTPTCRLEPDELLSFVVSTELPVRRGTYQGRLQLNSMVSATLKQPEILAGRLWLDLGEIKVTR